MTPDSYGKQWSTPVLILNCKIGGLAIIRSLGRLGVPVYGIDDDPKSAALKSRYLKQGFLKKYEPTNPDDYLEYLLAISKIIGRSAVLVPTSDDLSVFVAKYRSKLASCFMFPQNDAELLDRLADKQKMFCLAKQHGVPTPDIISPQNIDDVRSALPNLAFPIMLKGIDGNRLLARTGKKMVIVKDEDELLKNYEELEDPDDPNLMLQELIPGGDDQVYIFNGYFNNESNCLAGFTGTKVRQYPVHVGCASLGECRWYDRVADKTIALMQAVGYKGILDIGYRLDPRDNRYKVLDINPRIGQAFRLFVAENDMDVVRSLYLDMTGQSQPEIKPQEGRRWLIEDFDLVSTYDYFREGSLSVGQWLKSFRGLKEAAWFSWRDPIPFLKMLSSLFKRIVRAAFRRLSATSRFKTSTTLSPDR